MRPRLLAIRAFGPYANAVELDFRDLGASSLFLIHGPTGAGKTTILDAMCFALFGQAAGTDRKGKDARSHFAEPDVATEVTLEFSLGADVWRVRRVAEQMRAGGTTVKPAQASLERIGDGGAGELRASKVRDVDARVAELLGFEMDQFRQVVLLPQGEFRRLLTADSKDRERILETLFGAELYRRIEAELKRVNSALERDVAEIRTRIDELLRAGDAATIEAVRERHAAEAARRDELTARGEALRRHSAEAADALREGERVAAAHAERTSAEAELARVAAQASQQEQRRAALAAARRATQLEAPLARYASAAAAAAKEEKRCAEAARARDLAERERSAATSALAAEIARAGEREAAADQVRRLDEARKAAVRLHEVRARIAAAQTRLADATGAASYSEREIAYAEGRLHEHDRELERLRPLAADLERRRARVAELAQVESNVAALAAARSFLHRQSVEVGGARERLARNETIVAERVAAEADVLRRWSEGQAALLAKQLRDGDPCPVCGATAHPAPAAASHALPSQNDLDAARAAIEQARRETERLRGQLEREQAKETERRREVAALEGALGARGAQDEDWTSESAASAHERAKSELVEAGRAELRIRELEKERQSQLEAIATAAADRDAARARMVEEDRQIASDSAIERELATTVPDDLANGDLDSQHAAARARLEKLQRAHDAAAARNAAAVASAASAIAAADAASGALVEARSALEDAASRLDGALAESGFASKAEAEAARRSAAETDALEGEIRRFDEALAAARARAERATAAAADSVLPDVAGLRARSDAARAALEANVAETARLGEAMQATARRLADLEQLAARVDDAEARYRAVGRVAAIAEGRNDAGMSFARYVLGTLLDEVLAAATERLLRMSQGRFALVRAGDRRDRRRSGGLDLEVFDAHTGVARPVATLSGGESFLASLALALGLADIVQAHSGGIRLETMFVDEGFGTLDPEALDLAMRALEDLRHGGRLVGIISHVPELRERIGARLEVVAGRRGSTARFVR